MKSLSRPKFLAVVRPQQACQRPLLSSRDCPIGGNLPFSGLAADAEDIYSCMGFGRQSCDGLSMLDPASRQPTLHASP
eukprot:scaffold65388_cov28-Prasinocladus_malaysianus.AAC.1